MNSEGNTTTIQTLESLNLLPGDILLSRKNTWLSRTIRKFGKIKTGSAKVSHAALCLGKLTEKPEVIEALWKVIRNPLSKYDKEQIVIFRKRGLNQAQRNEIALKCISVENQAYGILKLPLFALDSLTHSYFFTQTFGLSNYKVCSNLIAWAYEKAAGIKFGVGWRSVQPDTIYDFCVSKQQDWEIILNGLSR